MSKNLCLLVDFQLYDSVTPTNDPADVERLKNTIQDPNVTASSRQRVVVPNSASNQAVAIPNPTNLLIIATDQPITMALNGAAAVTLTPVTPGKKNVVFYLRGTATSLSFSNTSGSAANVDVIAVVG